MSRGILIGDEIGNAIIELLERKDNQPFIAPLIEEENMTYEGVKLVANKTEVLNDGKKIKAVIDVYGRERVVYWYADGEEKGPGEEATITKLEGL